MSSCSFPFSHDLNNLTLKIHALHSHGIRPWPALSHPPALQLSIRQLGHGIYTITYSLHQVSPRPRKLRLQNNVRLRKRILIFLKKGAELRAEILGPRRIRGPSHFERTEVAVNVFDKRAKKGLPNGSPAWRIKAINASQSVGATRKLRGASSAI